MQLRGESQSTERELSIILFFSLEEREKKEKDYTLVFTRGLFLHLDPSVC